MATKTLKTDVQERTAKEILEFARRKIDEVSKGNKSVAHAVRRYVWIRLKMDEGGTTAKRKNRKMKLFDEQKCRCAICDNAIEQLSECDIHHNRDSGEEELVHRACHRTQQEKDRYK